ncbi:MAG: response regulator transcription factor [Chloroflexota bacterium]
MRQGIVRILADAPDVVLVGRGADAADARKLALAQDDACVLDLAMPGGGVDFVNELHELRPRLRILVFTMHKEQQYALRVLAAGSVRVPGQGCPPRGAAGRDPLDGVGRRYLSDEVAELLAERVLDGPAESAHEKLSPRASSRSSRRLAAGEGSSEIAGTLRLWSSRCRRTAPGSSRKLGLCAGTDLTRYAGARPARLTASRSGRFGPFGTSGG